MKTLIAAVAIACVAIVLVEISEAQGNNRCSQVSLSDARNTTCDRRANPMRCRMCVNLCRQCYSRRQLARRGGCISEGRCVCLSRRNCTTEPPLDETTTLAPEDPEDPTTPFPEDPEDPTTPFPEDPEDPEDPVSTVSP